ncbi:MAG TPA: hypothetical protein VHV77_16850 [Pirellulales bacterium]|jgi:hypothetical protein|nr:hypothetical protein [Pirellulales bacterium]
MGIDRHYSRAARIAHQTTAGHLDKAVNKRLRLSNRARGKRARGFQINERLPFVPPENWHEPCEDGRAYRIVVQEPGVGYRHVLTPEEVRARLAELPEEFVAPLEVVQFSQMTRKKQSFPCYGMQWGSTLYLYPIETGLTEYYDRPPKPHLVNEARMYGGRWEHDRQGWRLVWTEQAIKDFYLNNILIHELGHLLDNRNSRSIDRERYAEWFAIRYGYQPTRARRRESEALVVRRHAKR